MSGRRELRCEAKLLVSCGIVPPSEKDVQTQQPQTLLLQGSLARKICSVCASVCYMRVPKWLHLCVTVKHEVMGHFLQVQPSWEKRWSSTPAWLSDWWKQSVINGKIPLFWVFNLLAHQCFPLVPLRSISRSSFPLLLSPCCLFPPCSGVIHAWFPCSITKYDSAVLEVFEVAACKDCCNCVFV